MRPILTQLAILALAAVAFAGCADEAEDGPEPADAVDRQAFQFEAGTGAIAGLLVDDRFRPIQLTDDPQTEFQTTGFVLLQETGEQVQTTENGEFSFVDLDPGMYTLRVTADGHEATPSRVGVQEGEFAETSVVARRVSSIGSTIITQEYSMFIACAADYLANGGNLPCDLDLSAEAYSSDFNTNLTGFGEDLTFLVTEMKSNQEKCWEVQTRTGGRYYAAVLDCGDYITYTLERGVNADEHQDNPGYEDLYEPWLNDDGFQTIMFVDHDFREEHQAILGGTLCCGIGFSAGVKATFLQSVFVGPPEVDVASYCALC